jgi:hypothetical protein
VRFVERTEPDHSMVSVRLRRIDGQARGDVFLPMRQKGDALTTQSAPDAGVLSAVEALGLATTRAFEFRTDIAVVDTDGLWRPEWGTLHRLEAQSPLGAAGRQAAESDSGADSGPGETGLQPELQTADAEIDGMPHPRDEP